MNGLSVCTNANNERGLGRSGSVPSRSFESAHFAFFLKKNSKLLGNRDKIHYLCTMEMLLRQNHAAFLTDDGIRKAKRKIQMTDDTHKNGKNSPAYLRARTYAGDFFIIYL